MRIIYLIILLIIFSIKDVSSQSFDLGSWNILNVKYNHTDKLSLFGEGQIRSLKFYNYFHYYELKAGVNYKIHKSVQLTFAVGSYQTFKEGGNFEIPKNNDEFRFWPQITLYQNIDKFKIEQRLRTEFRWTSNGFRNRFRYRAGISYPFGKDTKGYNPFQASFSNELFFTDNEPYFERNRYQLALSYKTTKNSLIQLGYLHQFDYKINDETGRDFLVVGFYYELFGKKQSKKKQDNELKDN